MYCAQQSSAVVTEPSPEELGLDDPEQLATLGNPCVTA